MFGAVSTYEIPCCSFIFGEKFTLSQKVIPFNIVKSPSKHIWWLYLTIYFVEMSGVVVQSDKLVFIIESIRIVSYCRLPFHYHNDSQQVLDNALQFLWGWERKGVFRRVIFKSFVAVMSWTERETVLMSRWCWTVLAVLVFRTRKC